MINSIAIYCGSALGEEPIYAEQAAKMGKMIAQRGQVLVYGGGRSGLMGIVADHALQAGGRVIGVMPTLLVDQELAHPELTELHIVETMQQRKLKMSELADGFIALPGGAGTLEEIFEQWTWAQLAIHSKPCGFLNTAHFYTPLLQFLQHSVKAGFTHQRFVDKLIVSHDVADILQQLDQYVPPFPKWKLATDAVEEK